MAEYIKLPDGSFLELKEGQSPIEGMMAARQAFPELFAKKEEAPKKDTTGFKAAAAAGLERLGGEFELLKGKLGVKDTAEAQREYEAAQKRAEARFTPTEKGWAEDPFLKFRETLGGSVPYAIAPAAAGLAALAAPVSAPVAAGLGLVGAGAVSAGQFTGSNIARQMEPGKTLDETSLGAAFAAAVPQALLDTAAMALLPGVGKLFGSVGSKLTAEQAKAIASQTLTKTLGDYAVKTGGAMTREGFTEAAQQALERVQAGLNIADPEARKEYVDSFIGGAVLGGTLAPAGRFVERGAAKDQAAKLARQERAQAQQAAAQQAEATRAQEEAQAEAERNSPEYATRVGQQYDTLLEEFKTKRAALTKPGKDATPVEKAEYADAQKEVKTLNEQLKELVPEYRRTERLRAQAQEEARKAGLSPTEYMLEQAGEVPETKIAPTTPDMAGFYMPEPVVPEAAPTAEQQLQTYAGESIELANEQRMAREKDFASAKLDYVQYLMRDPIRADQMVKTRTPMPGLSQKQGNQVLDALKLQVNAYKQELAQEAAAGTQSAQARLAALESEEAEAGANVPPPAEQLAPGVGSEIMALQRMGAQPAGLQDQFQLFGQPGQPQAPSAAMGQMQQRLAGEDVTATGEEAPRVQRGEKAPFQLRAAQEGMAEPTTYSPLPRKRDDLLDRINRVLTTYDLSPEAVDFLRRVEQTLPQADTTITREPQVAMVRGKPVRVSQDTGSYFELLDRQLERIESGEEGVPRKGERRSVELQAFPAGEARAETAPPTEATAEDIKQFRSAQPGQAQTMTQMEQAALAQRRKEGKGGRLPGFVYQPEEGERQAVTAGPTPVKKRVTEMGPSTLRGESALPQDLSMARDVEEQLRLLETVADEGVQRPLFPEEQEAVKLTRAGFQTYLKSPKVEALRKALRRDQEVLKRAEQIPELEKRAKALVEEIDGILKSYAEYRSADAIVQANKDVNQARRDIAEIRSAAGKAAVNRMMLAGRVQQLQEARRDVVEEGRRQGETVEPDFLAELDAVTDAMQEAQTDLALLDSALSTLDGQLRSFTALKKMSSLVEKSVAPERIPAAQKELVAVRTELEKLREDYNEVNNRLRKEAADRKRAEAAVKEAERKAIIEAGRLKPLEEMKQQLPEYDQAVQYPALTEAQRLAREKGGKLPELSEAEKVKIKGEPTQVLGGFRAEIARLEKGIRQSQDTSRSFLYDQLVGPKQAAYDKINKQYKAAKSAAERDALGERLDKASRELEKAKDDVRTAPITWKGMKRDIARLASTINKADWLESMIDAGRLETKESVPKTYRKKLPAAQLAEERAAAVREAAVRAEAPATSGEALTRSEVAKARKAQKTVFEGKGVPGGTAKEIPSDVAAGYARAARYRERLAEDLKNDMEPMGGTPQLKAPTLFFKGTPTYAVQGAERQAINRVLPAFAKERAGGGSIEDRLTRAFVRAESELRGDIELFSGDANPKYRDMAEKAKAALQALRGMNVKDFSLTPTGVAVKAPPKGPMPARKPVAQPVAYTRADFTSDEVAKSLSTKFVEDAPFHGMTFADAARYGAKRTTSPQVKALFEKLAEVFDSAPVQDGAGRVYAVDSTIDGKYAGIYNSGKDVIYTRAPTKIGVSANKVLLHELTHAATVRAMQLNPELGRQMEELRRRTADWLTTPEGRTYFRNHSMGLGRTPASIYGLTNNKEFVAELFANREFQKMLAEIPSDKPRKSIFTRFVETLSKFFQMPGKAAQSLFAEAVALTEQVLDVTKNEIYEGKAPAGGFLSDVSPMVAEPNALTDLADKISSQPKTFKERWGKLTALEGEMQGVDMRAGLREALKAGAEGLGDTKLFNQTMYNVLKADQKMPLVYTVMSRGPLEQYKDDAGMYGVRSTNKNSAVDVFDAINEIPVGDARQKMNMAQAYLVAQRALNKGVEKLDIGALGLKEADLRAALDAAKADKELGAALEKVRRVYNAYNKGMIDFLAATGAIPKATAEKLNATGDYVPFYRVDANGKADLVFSEDAMITIGDIRRQPYLAELKGGETKLLPLDEAIPRNTILLTDKALTNMATKSVAYGLQAIGKPAGKMQIHSGKAPADPGVIKFNQEPDPNDKSDTGERWVKIDTEDTLAEGVPSALLVKSLEGAHMPLPGFLKFAGKATDILRAGVTRTPLYIARQLLREPMSAAFTGGLNYNTFTAVLKAGKEFVKMTRGTSEAEAKLLEKGLIQSGIFTGDVDDMGKFALQLVKGDQNAMEKLFAITDKAAIKADAATRALVYENAIANGLSEVEADMMTMESMNFYKRGLSPTVQYASRLIPFLNAQIQGLNVLYKAATGKMPFEEQQRIKRKFFNNAALLAATGIVYAMAMEDDETWRNARPRDKMSNFFIPLPGTDELLKLPIPFEAGYFYSLAVAAVEGMREQTDGKAQWSAIRDLFLNSVPGYSSMGVPQIVKPIAEIWTNKNFLSGAPIESLRLQGLSPEERYNATTTEFAKMLSRALPILSPIQIEHLVRGYLGVLPLAAAAGANSLFAPEGKGERPEGRLSEMPLLGSAFQKKFGGANADLVFEAAQDAMEARTTFNKMLSEGRRDAAITYRNEHRAELAMAGPAGQYRQLVGRINADIRRTQEREDLNAQEKRQRLDRLEEAKQQAAERFLKAQRAAQERVEKTIRLSSPL